MLPLCREEGIGMITFSPLARGRLGRPWSESSTRSETDNVTERFYAQSADADRQVVEVVQEIAQERGIPQAHVAMAWVNNKPEVTAPIVGATKLNHLDDAVAALDVTLTDEEINRLEAPYVPHSVVGLN